MGRRLVSLQTNEGGFSPFVDVTLNGMAAMFVFLAVYVAVVPPPPPIKIHTNRLPAAVWYKGYETAISVRGGIGSYTFEYEPIEELEKRGLFCESNGMISGTPRPSKAEDPSKNHSIMIRITVKDGSSRQDTAEVELKINPTAVPFDPEQQPLSIPCNITRLPDAWIGKLYKFAPSVCGGIEPYDLEWEGMPPGVEPTKSFIEGVPKGTAVPRNEEYKDYTLRLLVKDQQSKNFPKLKRNPTIEKTFTMRVHRLNRIQLIDILPSTRTGHAYLGAIIASGGMGRLIWETTDDGLNSIGLHLDSMKGTITGTINMTQYIEEPFPVCFGVRVRDLDDDNAVVRKDFTIIILPPMHFISPR